MKFPFTLAEEERKRVNDRYTIKYSFLLMKKNATPNNIEIITETSEEF